jgi:hypothetical protein
MYLLVTSEGCCHCGICPQVFVNYCECSSIPLILKANLKGGYGARLTIIENHSVDHRNTRIFFSHMVCDSNVAGDVCS